MSSYRVGSGRFVRWAPVFVFLCFVGLVGNANSALQADFDGDGFSDLAVGVPGEDIRGIRDAGAVRVIRGSAGGLTGEQQVWHLGGLGIRPGPKAGDQFGSALATGDFNRDGYADLAVGMPLRNRTRGQVVVLFGSPTGLVADGYQLLDQGPLADDPEDDDLFGAALAAGDFDADGYDDLAIGVPGEDFPDLGAPQHEKPACGICRNAGIVNLVYGGSTGLGPRNELWHQDRGITYDGFVEWQDCFGSSLTVGDFDANGVADLAVGVACEWTGGLGESEPNDGAVSVYYGRRGTGLTGQGAVYLRQWAAGSAGSEQRDDALGYAVAAGDFNADGVDDLAIGVPGEETDVANPTDGGALMIYYGLAGRGVTPERESLNVVWGRAELGLAAPSPGAHWGWSLAAGDFNDDGIDDIAVGAPGDGVGDQAEAGTVAILRGSPSGIRPTGNRLLQQGVGGIHDQAEAGDWFGQTLSTGDFNGDGVIDLAVGAPFENGTSTFNDGAVSILMGGSLFGTVAMDSQHVTQVDVAGDGPEDEDQFGGRFEPRLLKNPWPTSPNVESVVAIAPGTVRGSVMASPAVVDLSATGTRDWAHWGRTRDVLQTDRKVGVTPLIGAIESLGAAVPVSRRSATSTYTWSDGAPRLRMASNRRGVRVTGPVGSGFLLPVATEEQARTLRLHVGLSRANARLRVRFAGAEEVLFETVLEQPVGVATRMVELRYQGEYPGQQLAIEIILDALPGKGAHWMTLESAAVDGG